MRNIHDCGSPPAAASVFLRRRFNHRAAIQCRPTRPVRVHQVNSSAGRAHAPHPHRATIEKLADELGLPERQVEIVYLEQVHRLERGARIKTFVPVLAAGATRTALRHRRPH